ncbi:MAG: amidohydrolase family protein [Gemmatimonas sp.]
MNAPPSLARTIDADAHVLENPYTWEFVDPALKRYAPMVVRSAQDVAAGSGATQREFWVIDGRLQPKEANVGRDTAEESREMRDISARLKHMDELEVDIQVLYPTVFLRPLTLSVQCELAITKAYNRWLAEIWKRSNGRLPWVACPPLLSMGKVREELAWAKDNGACGIFLRGFECERRLIDPYFHPLWEIAGDLDLPLCLHSGTGAFQVHDFFKDDSGFSRFKLSVVSAFHELIFTGLPAQFPKTRWGFVEVSSQWLPYVLNDLGLRFKRRGKRLSPTILQDYRMYVAMQVTDDLGPIVDLVGSDNLVVGTDYGHNDTSSEIEALRLLKTRGGLQPAVVDKILGDNARALYGLR